MHLENNKLYPNRSDIGVIIHNRTTTTTNNNTLNSLDIKLIYLRDARAGKIKKAAKQRLSVIGADGRCRVGEQVVVKHALPEKLVEKPGWVRRAQGASEPGMLDGDIHIDNRRSGSCSLWRRV